MKILKKLASWQVILACLVIAILCIAAGPLPVTYRGIFIGNGLAVTNVQTVYGSATNNLVYYNPALQTEIRNIGNLFYFYDWDDPSFYGTVYGNGIFIRLETGNLILHNSSILSVGTSSPLTISNTAAGPAKFSLAGIEAMSVASNSVSFSVPIYGDGTGISNVSATVTAALVTNVLPPVLTNSTTGNAGTVTTITPAQVTNSLPAVLTNNITGNAGTVTTITAGQVTNALPAVLTNNTTGNATTASYVGGALTNQLYASNVVSGGQLPIGTVATNATAPVNSVLQSDGTSRFWTGNPTVTNLVTATITNSGVAQVGSLRLGSSALLNFTNSFEAFIPDGFLMLDSNGSSDWGLKMRGASGTNFADIFKFTANGGSGLITMGSVAATYFLTLNSGNKAALAFDASARATFNTNLTVLGPVALKDTLTATNGFIPQVKVGFSTNYTCLISDAVLFCTGTNQIITLLSATNAATVAGKTFTIIAASTTGSVIVTNANGVQTVQGALSVVVNATNRLVLSSDGANWW
jgi:hypothetical protein